METATVGAHAVLVAACLCAAYLDIRYRRLPNWLSGLTLIAGIVLAGVAGGFAAVGAVAIHVIIALGVGMALFAMGWIGAGDAKFYAAVSAWFSWHYAAALAGAIGIGGLVLLIAWFPLRKMGRGKEDPLFRQLPFGVAIALGALLAHFGVALIA